jgi:uncharacterized protein (DUF1501 family)
MAYVGAGGFNSTAGLVPLSRINNTQQLQTLSNPNSVPWDRSQPIRSSRSMTRIQALRQKRLDRMMARTDLMGRDRTNLEAFNKAVEGQALLKTVADKIENPSWDHSLRARIDVALTAFQTGVASAADTEATHDFDSHANHDGRHHQALSDLNTDIDYLWSKAEELGIANRLTVLVGSDFGRTPHYNDSNRKDHHPIGSMIVMRKNASWANRTVGMTDSKHAAMRVNPRSLQADHNNGTIIYPKHTHKALQSMLGIESFAQSAGWGINTDSFNFFG